MIPSPESPEQSHPSPSPEYEGIDDVERFEKFTEENDLDPKAAARVDGEPIVNNYLEGYKSITIDKPTGITVLAERGATPKGLQVDPDVWQKSGHLSELYDVAIDEKKGAKLSTGISNDYLVTRVEPYLISDQNEKISIEGGRNSTLIAFPLQGKELAEVEEYLHDELGKIPDALLHTHDSADTTRELIEQAIAKTASGDISPRAIPEEVIKGSEHSIERQRPLSTRLSLELTTLDQAYTIAQYGELPSDPREAAKAILEATDRTREINPPFGVPFEEDQRATMQPKLEEILAASIEASQKKDELRLAFKEAHPNRVGVRSADLEKFAQENGLEPPKDTEIRTEENIEKLLLALQPEEAETPPAPAEAIESPLEQEPPQKDKFWRKFGRAAANATRSLVGRANMAAAAVQSGEVKNWLQKQAQERESLSPRRKKLYKGLAVVAGVAAVGAAAYLNVDIDVSSIDFSPDAPTPAPEQLPVETSPSPAPEQPTIEAPPTPEEPATASAEAGPAFAESTATMEPGGNIWDKSREALQAQGIENPSIEQINEVKNATLDANGLTEETARGIDPGQKIKIVIPGRFL